MATHAVPHYANSFAVDLDEVGEDGLGELGCDVAVHFVAFGPGFFCRIHVEARAGAKVVGVVFALDVKTSFLALSAYTKHRLMLPSITRIRICSSIC